LTIDGVSTPEQHVSKIVAWFRDVVIGKYYRGQKEHGGDLWIKTRALASLEEEIIDLPVYYKTAKDQLHQMAKEGMSAKEAYEYLYGEKP
tara:strand:- start:14140 stop:14409 length:270 start_codon:yes stop_codon:yes gene_type:complete